MSAMYIDRIEDVEAVVSVIVRSELSTPRKAMSVVAFGAVGLAVLRKEEAGEEVYDAAIALYVNKYLVRPVRPVHPLSSLWAWTAKLLNDLHYPVYCFMIWLCMLKESPSLIEVLIGTAGVLLLRLRRWYANWGRAGRDASLTEKLNFVTIEDIRSLENVIMIIAVVMNGILDYGGFR